METVLGTYRDGQITLERPVDWPNGAALEVRLGASVSTSFHAQQEERCVDGSKPPCTPEEIEEWLKWFDSIEPLGMSPEEEARLEADREEFNEFNKQAMRKQWDEMEKMF